eukprot:CAMPEP_0119102014 /NCGR_PEP_ID=MMETSP1180-20130426/897_1 /TAXON_ID=3052 ORGANISM="Chlamydomonas cf sp, Strain CCMP681" /NCGR_SAMPLE_ID=MMETSP1180 /ASSEMBLY_ACC=CAM_ASM_000741 /LENGTH=223 /DNA_ID=CAMNT_0007086223 /DNA_START=42 /DNA_END=713 /DNA_ORIENTATION=-
MASPSNKRQRNIEKEIEEEAAVGSEDWAPSEDNDMDSDGSEDAASDSSEEEARPRKKNTPTSRVAELEAQVIELQKENKRLKGLLGSAQKGGGAGGGGSLTPQQATASADKLRVNIVKLIEQVMVYRNKNTKSRVNITIPCVREEQMEALLGPALYTKLGRSKAKTGACLKLQGADLEDLLGQLPSKSLRYGSQLQLVESTLSLKYDRTDNALKLTGAYSMVK